MQKQMTRRRLMTAGVGIAALGVLPGGGLVVRSAMTADTKVRITTGLRATTHSMSWLGAEAGIFKKHGLDVSYPAIEMGGPEAAAGLMRGDWEFCHTGALPVAENFLNGGDVVALLRNTLPHPSQFVATQRELTNLAQLNGKRVGVLSDATSGQTGVRTRQTVERGGATATYVGLGNFQNIYNALVKGEIDAGVIPIHMRFSGERQHGWNIFALADSLGDLPSVFATTRKLIASNRDLVMRVVKGYVETIHAFKTQRDVYIPVLQRFLSISDRKVVEDLHKFYVPLFPQAPRVALGAAGMQSLKDNFSKKYPAAQKLQESDFVDSSFIDELEQSGFIKQLYAGDAKR
jgi:ABC-type nitrate/sulfonate/bicarbonate transport system substrate-binding protein